ncbi:MAG: hypothetical protein ACI9A7_002063 [Cyclobacteriaceae bacterium]|jgi:hypothetical protein
MKVIFNLIFLFTTVFATAQSQDESQDIVAHIDELTQLWDADAKKLYTYTGLEQYCKTKAYRDKTISTLNYIHHYDSVLYDIVSKKYDTNADKEAKATLEDIKLLEVEYTTKSFLKFLHKECGGYNFIESNLSAPEYKSEYNKEVARLEKELKKYVSSITKQIDIIDEHVHHLKGL